MMLVHNLLIKKIIPGLFAMSLLSSCYYDNQEELHPIITTQTCDTTGTISFANDILPILNASCGTDNSCHGTTTTTYNLSGYTSDLQYVAEFGKLVRSIKHDASIAQSKWMPSGGGSLNSCDIQKIEAWVNRGFANN